jgi:hypothetical protein
VQRDEKDILCVRDYVKREGNRKIASPEASKFEFLKWH